MKKLMTILAMFAMVGFVSCQKPADNSKKNDEQKEEQKPDDQKPDDQKPDDQKPDDNPPVELTIDGSFEDWAGLAKGTYSQTYGDEEATHPALTHCKVYATAEKIFVYVEWDVEQVSHDPGDPNDLDEWGDPKGKESVPFHCYINTDGNTATGGFSDQYADASIDVLLEGFIYPDGANVGSYAPGAFAWNGDPNGSGWAWAELGDVTCEGAGVDGKYELSISCADLKGLGFPVADVFSIGFDIQQGWDSVGVLPNAAPSEDNASGVVNSLSVTVQK